MFKTLQRLKNVANLLQLKQATGQMPNHVARRTLATAKIFNTPAKDDEAALADSTTKINKNPFAQEPKQEVTTQQESDEDREQRLKVLQLEADIAFQEGRRVPQVDFFEPHHWEYILTLPSKSARMKYYGYLWQVEMKRESKQRKKIERAEAAAHIKEEHRKEREENTHIIYGLGHTSMFLRIYDSSINQWQNNRLTRAMQFSPKMVLDCSYDAYMNQREAINAAKQLMLCFAENRAHDDPFDLHYCNVDMSTICSKALLRYIPTMLNPEFPMNVHKKCFTEVFPKQNLVYLTPHCRTDLEEYNPDDVYIIGAMVDTVNNDPLSLAKAKKLGLRMARLPLDRYLQWGSGSGKSLTLNQVLNIMLDVKSTGNWTKSLSHVPRRKIVDLSVEQVRQRNSLNKRAERLNIRVDSLFEADEDAPQRNRRSVTKFARPTPPPIFDDDNEETAPKQVRSRKEGLEFKLETWASKKKQQNG